jgi:hypothetical protein
MKKTKTSTSRYLIIGLILFPLGLFMLFRQTSFISLLNNIIPASETIDIFGVILLFIGEGAIAYGIIGSVANKVIANAEQDRVVYANTLTHVMDQQTAISASMRSMQDQVGQVHTRVQQIQAAAMSPQIPRNPTNCKFCGANMGEGRFCPNCGRAQT